MRLPSFTLLLALAGLALLSCVDDSPVHPGRGATAQLGLLASITGLSADGDYTIRVRIISAGSTGPADLPIEPRSFALSADAATVQPITVDLSSCPEGCSLSAILTLSDDLGDLASDTLDLGVVHQGDQVTPADTVKMVPQYQLTIDGGGAGTGTGTVDVAAAGGEPALRCEIRDGQAAATGCSASYPIHTAITLVPTAPRGTTLESWAGDCAATVPDAPCDLTMDGRRTVRARFGLPPTTGDLEVQIAGLPSGTPAPVTVTNARGFTRQVTESALLASLEPGDYTVAAEPVTVPADQVTYTPEPPSQSITVVAGERAVAQIGYNPPTTGSLAVTMSGLPDGVAAQVTVTGPGFPSPQQLTVGSTFAGLQPGSYTVTARSATGPNGQPYDPSVTPAQPVAVVAGRGTTVTVDYSVPLPAKVVFTGQPGTVASGVVMSPPVTLEIRDAQDRLAPGFTSQVALSLRGGAAGAKLSGTTAVIPQRGVATFSTLTVDLAAAGYVLAAGAGTLPTAESAPFTVVAGAVSPGRSTIGVSRATLRTCCGTDTVTVTARDAAGNPVQGATVNLSATGTGNVLFNPASPTDANGATQGSFASRTIGAKTISAVINGIGLTSAATVEVRAGLIFSRFMFSVGDIVATNPDGTEAANLTVTGRHEGEPAWSPDGSRVAYVVTFCPEGCFTDIYSMSADGSDTLNLTANLEGSASSPAWSPDGSRIAFTLDTCNDGCIEVAVMNRDGSNPQSLTGESGGSSPTWSPLGERIAFTRFSCGERGCWDNIWVLQIAQNDSLLLTGDRNGPSDSPAWSPDGSRIAFASQPCDTCRSEIFTMNATDGSKAVSLTPSTPRAALSPTWSPDGRRIAFATACTFEFCENDLFVMNDNGSGLAPLGLGTDPDWR